MINENIKNKLAIIYFYYFGKTFGRGYERYKINLIKNKISNKKVKIKKNSYFDERIIEIPWIIKELKKCNGNLLDVGSTLNFEYILKSIPNLNRIFINTLYPEKINFNNSRNQSDQAREWQAGWWAWRQACGPLRHKMKGQHSEAIAKYKDGH